MLVKYAMSTEVYTLSPDDTVIKIVKKLIKYKIHGAPVVNKKNEIVGIVAEKDLFYKLFPTPNQFYEDPEYYMDFNNIQKEAIKVKLLKASQIMSTDIVSVDPDDHILKACSIFAKNRFRRLPVVKNGKLVGILTTNDIYKRFLDVFWSEENN